MQTQEIDLLIIGGGINGTGIAADAAGRGLSVVLCEDGDLAAATSSASSKLIHGGLRYLEQYDFKLVRAALNEREILWHKAPHLIHPLQFILPYNRNCRPAWLMQLGLFLYDHLAKHSTLPHSQKINFATQDFQLRPTFKVGFSYFDCQTDDARLVIANALAAQTKGAQILTRTRCIAAQRIHGQWQVKLQHHNTQKITTFIAKGIINATGPWVNQVLQNVFQLPTPHALHLVQGSHIVIPKLYEGQHAFTLQTADQRVVFVMPFEDQFTLIGTTEIPFKGNLDTAHITTPETHYLCNIVNSYLKSSLSEHDVLWSYSGVRALFDYQMHAPSKMSREYHFEIVDEQGQAPILSVFGGKITTFRILAEQALQNLKKYFPHMGTAWTTNTPLPGGDLQGQSFVQFTASLQQQYPWLPPAVLLRYARSYGSLSLQLLAGTKQLSDLGRDFGAGLYGIELDYLRQHEWAQTAEDILWRRTKLGLVLSNDQQNEVKNAL